MRGPLNVSVMKTSRLIFVSATILTFVGLATTGRAADEWADYQTVGRFEVRSEVPIRQSQAISEFVLLLPSLERGITSSLNIRSNNKPIVINVFQSQQNYQKFVAQRAQEGRGRRALFVEAETHGSVYVYLHEDVLTDLRHETTHAILHSSLPFIPLWLDEGLAEYFEVAREHRASGNPHLRRAKLDARLILAWHPNLTQLERIQNLSAMTTVNYRESWAWVHFLLHGPDEARAILAGYLADIEAHDPPGPLSDRLHRVWPKPERELTSHLKSWK